MFGASSFSGTLKEIIHMKRLSVIVVLALAISLVFSGCKKEEAPKEEARKEERMSAVGQSCAKTADCEERLVCLDQKCCQSNCDGKECGPNGCDGTCGECLPGWTCTEHKCCQSRCDGKECGPDACGGSCGACSFQQECGSEGQCRLKKAPQLYLSLWEAMARHEDTYLGAYAEQFRTKPEDAMELLTAFTELVYNVTGHGGLWRKTVPQKYFGCSSNSHMPICRKFEQLQANFVEWDKLQEAIMDIETESQAREFLQAHGKELREYIKEYVPENESFSAVQKTPFFSKNLVL
jgi:hypothetical protein